MEKKFIPKRSQEEMEAFFRKNGGLVKNVSDPKPQSTKHLPETTPEVAEETAPEVVYAPQESHVELNEIPMQDDVFEIENNNEDAQEEDAVEDAAQEDLGDFEVMVEMEVEEEDAPAVAEEEESAAPVAVDEPLDLGELDLEKKEDEEFNFDF